MGTPPSRNGQFEPGAKFEAIDPLNPSNIVVATVIRSLRFNYFIAGVESSSTNFICHANSKSIFPVNWCRNHKINLMPPRGKDLLICLFISLSVYLPICLPSTSVCLAYLRLSAYLPLYLFICLFFSLCFPLIFTLFIFSLNTYYWLLRWEWYGQSK